MNLRGLRVETLLVGLLLGLILFVDPVRADDTALNLRVVDEHILPGYRLVAERVRVLDVSTKALCSKVSNDGLADARKAFTEAMSAWQQMQHIRFGPVELLLRHPRFQLWPDKRGSTDKHLAQLLAAADPAALEATRFAQGSVAVQGFGAMERLLFGKNAESKFIAEDAGSYRCALLRAISENLLAMSSDLVRDWHQGENAYRQVVASAVDGNDYFESEAEVSSRLLNNLYTELQLIVDYKLDQPLGERIEKARGRRAESWRSALSLANIRANLMGLRNLYEVGFAPRLNPDLQARVSAAFDQALVALEGIDQSLAEAVADPASRSKVEALRAKASQLKGLFAKDVPEAAGIALGFNSLDGD